MRRVSSNLLSIESSSLCSAGFSLSFYTILCCCLGDDLLDSVFIYSSAMTLVHSRFEESNFWAEVAVFTKVPVALSSIDSLIILGLSIQNLSICYMSTVISLQEYAELYPFLSELPALEERYIKRQSFCSKLSFIGSYCCCLSKNSPDSLAEAQGRSGVTVVHFLSFS